MRKPISREDVRLLVYLPTFALVSWTLPQSLWSGLAKWLAGLPQPIAPFLIRSDERTQPGRMPPSDRAAQRILRHFQYLRELRPGGWTPKIIVENEDIAAKSLADGKGVVFWIANTRSADLVAKKGMAQIGVELHHLSRLEHGGSRSPFGKRVLNAIPRIAENRFLKERVRVDTGKELGATRRLKDILSAGNTVSITASSEGRQIRLVHVFGGVLPLATGAPALAYSTGAALIPVFCVQLAANKPEFRVALGPRISTENAKSRRDAVDSAIMRFAALHEKFLAQHAIQWRGFGYMIPSDKLDEAAAILEPVRNDLTG